MLTGAEIEEWNDDEVGTMWHSVDDHKKAVAYANEQAFSRFKVHGPYEPGTRLHEWWLTHYDASIRASRLAGRDYETGLAGADDDMITKAVAKGFDKAFGRGNW